MAKKKQARPTKSAYSTALKTATAELERAKKSLKLYEGTVSDLRKRIPLLEANVRQLAQLCGVSSVQNVQNVQPVQNVNTIGVAPVPQRVDAQGKKSPGIEFREKMTGDETPIGIAERASPEEAKIVMDEKGWE